MAITPNKARSLPIEEVRKVCQGWTISGFKAILDANPSPKQPLRFLYMSGAAASDPAQEHSKDTATWMPKSMVEYSHMRVSAPLRISKVES